MTNQFESVNTGVEAQNVGAAIGHAALEGAASQMREEVTSNGAVSIQADNLDNMKDEGVGKSDSYIPDLEIEEGNKAENHKDEGKDNSIYQDFMPERGAWKDIPEAGQIEKNPFKKVFDKVSDKDREKAKERLSEDISDLIPEKDQKALRQMQEALIDGDLDAFSKAVKEASSDPERMERLVKELNKQLSKNERMGGVDVHVSGDNVFMYSEDGDTALKIDSSTGEASIHPIEHRADGSVVMTPGEIINREPGETMQSIADEATRSLTRKGSLIGALEGIRKPLQKPKPFGEGIRPFFDKPGTGKEDGLNGHKYDFLRKGAIRNALPSDQ